MPNKMKVLLLILLTSTCISAQEIKATLKLSNGQFINNAPDGRDWSGWNVIGVDFYDSYSDTLYVDDGELGMITYYGNWRHAESGCFCSYSNTANDSIVFLFTDVNYFEWRGELMAHHGIADVYFDNKYIGEVDTYDPRNLTHTKNWKIENLDPAKVYKFKLVVTGKKNTESAGAYIVNHGFRVWKHTSAPPDPEPLPEPCPPEIVYVTDTVTVRDTIWMVPVFDYKPVKSWP